MLDDLQDGLNSAMGLNSMFLWYILGELVPMFWTSTRNGLSHYALLNGLLPDRWNQDPWNREWDDLWGIHRASCGDTKQLTSGRSYIDGIGKMDIQQGWREDGYWMFSGLDPGSAAAVEVPFWIWLSSISFINITIQTFRLIWGVLSSVPQPLPDRLIMGHFMFPECSGLDVFHFVGGLLFLSFEGGF